MPAYNTAAWASQPLNLEPDKPKTMPATTVTANAPAPEAPAPAPSAFGPSEQQALQTLARNAGQPPPPPPLPMQQQSADDDQLMYMIKQLLMRRGRM
jgi:hypothetical protein